VGVDQPVSQVDELLGLPRLADRGGGQDASQKAELIHILIAEAREIPLVKESEEHGALGPLEQATECLVGVPVGPEQVGAEKGERGFLLIAPEYFDETE